MCCLYIPLVQDRGDEIGIMLCSLVGRNTRGVYACIAIDTDDNGR